MRAFSSRRNGMASVEFVVTLPLYLMLVFGVLFFGRVTFIDQEMSVARAYATFNPGRDSDGELNTRVMSGYIGQLNVLAKAPQGSPAVSPQQDLDRDGEPDAYVDAEGPLSDDFDTTSYLFANFNHDHAPFPASPNDNELWIRGAETILQYTYTPEFSRFVYGKALTQEEYLTYQRSDVPTDTVTLDYHSSAVAGPNLRETARTYRSSEFASGSMPMAGQEEKLWNHLKVEDMKVLRQRANDDKEISFSPGSQAPGEHDLPPADMLTQDAQNIYRYERWDRNHVTNYDVLQGLEDELDAPECDPQDTW